jgi:DNA-binding transcriptional regulator YiaG
MGRMTTTAPPLDGRDLAAERVRAALSQRDVAAAMGISGRRVSHIEWTRRITPRLRDRYLKAVVAAVEARNAAFEARDAR